MKNHIKFKNLKKIYILHEYGAPSHYNGLIALCKKYGIKVKFRVFGLGAILKKFATLDIIDAILDIWFIGSIAFRKQTKIVLGIAPYNSKLPLLMKLLQKHKIYYHTSYTCWDGSHMAYPTKSEKLKTKWKIFTREYVKHIFAVSEKTKIELKKNGYSSDNRISVVKHSISTLISPILHDKNNNFVFVGRLDPVKGIQELLDIFSKRPDANITIIGDGILNNLVNKYVSTYPNIKYTGYIKGLNNIIPLYQQASFIIMNSQRTKTWEELFGIAIIEGMATGCVPITTDHSGPKEIITPNVDGFICKEGEIKFGIMQALALSNLDYRNMQKSAIETSRLYHATAIANRWSKILE